MAGNTRGARQTLSGGLLLGGRYRVERMLGRGGVATVYAVVDEPSGERLALKYLTLERGERDEPALALLQREYHTLEQIAHPGIVRVFDFGLLDDAAFYTMELLDGQDLSDAPPLPWPRACEVLCQVASALAMLHARRLIHRDVSHRNVRLTERAGAKLIDFGGMMPMGFALEIIGTPPFLSPEAVHGEPLDHRADLYGLGALAYWLLVHEHAYPARTVAEVKQAWARGEPRAPSERVADLPGPLSRLVMSLLAREPAARPRSMAEVIDALRAIAALPPMQEPEVARAYLTNPKLIGADGVLRRLNQGLARALRGRGGALLIEGGFGSGKSRILQELVRAAKVDGSHVVQLRGNGERKVAYALARDLLDAVLAQLPGAAQRLTPQRRSALAWLLPGAKRAAAGEGATTPRAGAPRVLRPDSAQEVRARVQTELIALLLELGAGARFAIAVDDAHACDDASLSLLAALAGTHQPGAPALLCSLRGSESGEALRALRARAGDRVQLRPLGLDGTQQLVESLFGGSPRSRALAAWLHARTQGNPLECVELARALVERGAVRYADGAFHIPESLPDDVPRDLAAAFAARIDALEPDARALAELLAVHGAPASVALCGECSGLAPAALFSALDRLVSAELVVASGDDYALSGSGIRDALLRALPPERRRALHQQSGEALLARGPHDRAGLLAAALQLLAGDAPLRGVDLLETAIPTVEDLLELGEAVVPALERALAVCEGAREPAVRALRLRVHLVTCAFFYDRRLLPHVDALLAQLYVDAAIEDWTHSGDSSLDGLTRALQRADERYRSAPLSTRGLPPLESLITFASTVASALGVAVLDQDFALIGRLARRVAPFASLPKEQGLALAYDLVNAVHESARGHVLRGDALRAELFANLHDPTKYAGVGPDARKSVLATQLHAMGVRRAAFDQRGALAIADQIDALGLRMYEGAAQQIRRLVQLYRGDQRAAGEHAARLEALSLQGPGRQTEVWLLGYLVSAYSALGDVMGLKHIAERLAELAPSHRGYLVALYCALGAYYRERGRLHESQAVLERALALAPCGENAYYARASHELCKTLSAAGLHRQAVELGTQSYAALAGTLEEPEVVALRLWPVLVDSEIALGFADRARARLEQVLARAEPGAVPLARLAAVHEALARVALAQQDSARCEQHVALAAECYRSAGNQVLLARLAAWIDEHARRQRDASFALRLADPAALVTVEDRPGPAYERLLAIDDAAERARRALGSILEQCAAERGALCLLAADGARVAADVGPTAVPAALIDALPELLDGALAGHGGAPAPARDESERAPAGWPLPDGGALQLVPLYFQDETQLHVVGAALVATPARAPDPAVTALIARALHEAGELGIAQSLDSLLRL